MNKRIREMADAYACGHGRKDQHGISSFPDTYEELNTTHDLTSGHREILALLDPEPPTPAPERGVPPGDEL